MMSVALPSVFSTLWLQAVTAVRHHWCLRFLSGVCLQALIKTVMPRSLTQSRRSRVTMRGKTFHLSMSDVKMMPLHLQL
jgi:hypothetical protein